MPEFADRQSVDDADFLVHGDPSAVDEMKVWIHVEDARAEKEVAPRRICWYMGTSDAQVLSAARLQLRLPVDAEFLLRDADGDLVPITSTLPHDQHFSLVLAEHIAVAQSEQGSKATASASNSERQIQNSPATGVTSPTTTLLTILPAPLGSSTSTAQAVDALPALSAAHDVTLPQEDLSHYHNQQPQQLKRRKLKTSSIGRGEHTNEPAAAPGAFDAVHHQPTVGLSAVPVPTTRNIATLYSPQLMPVATSASATPHARARSIATIVTQFLETFTKPILNDDNVNFIPNTGKYGLYALYSVIVADASFHPKGQDAFYKMTAMQGKVDRQRVIRFYQDTQSPSGLVEYVQYKPQGKGPFLRKYVGVESERMMHELVKRAGFVALMDLVPEQVVAKYLEFVKGFQPISKTVFRAHRQDASGNGGCDEDEGFLASRDDKTTASGQF
ncbi:hypothetical protein Gpo141_00008162 [Globisporangium polare]